MPAPSPRSPPGSPDALLLAKRVASSYRLHVGIELTDSKDPSPEGIFKAFWMHPHAIVCWVVKVGRPARAHP
jgi:homeobox-leucine zipper protein